MTYRDPREALQAENDCLRQDLKEAQEELAAARSTPEPNEYERRRWAMGMRCLGSLAMVAPFLAMMSMCEHRAMRRAAHGRTTVLITHRLSQIRWADVVVVLRGGAVEAVGRHDELLATCPPHRRVFLPLAPRRVPGVQGGRAGGAA